MSLVTVEGPRDRRPRWSKVVLRCRVTSSDRVPHHIPLQTNRVIRLRGNGAARISMTGIVLALPDASGSPLIGSDSASLPGHPMQEEWRSVAFVLPTSDEQYGTRFPAADGC